MHFAQSISSRDIKTGTLVTALLGAWYYRVSAEIGWPGVSSLSVGEIMISEACMSVWQHGLCQQIHI